MSSFRVGGGGGGGGSRTSTSSTSSSSRGGRGGWTSSTTSNNGGRGRSSTSSSTPGRGGRGGGGRGRGRGRGGGGKGQPKINTTLQERSFLRDDDDDICQQALGQYELETSEVSRVLEDANAATDLPGFDETAGQTWIYPTNKPVRDYQFQMVKTALFHNTLISLPTGLGKTFIAAVVMYNFQRWYPSDILVFMAPTRPLVAQQLDACHNLVGIHPSKTVELTGHTQQKKRDDLWKTKTVFFLTPQVLQSDLARGVCPGDRIRCVLVDEAHKALGQHAYVEVIKSLLQTNKFFRVLALSATPGSDLQSVQQVFNNLLISRVELRSETSPDVLPYIHSRQVDKHVVPLSPYLTTIHGQMMEVFQQYTGKLMQRNALAARDAYAPSLTQFKLLRAREAFRSSLGSRIPNYLKSYIEIDFATCISLAHAIDLLVCHGLRSFHTFLQGVINKEKGNAAVASELKKNESLQNILSEIAEKLNITLNSSFGASSRSSSLFPSPSRSYLNDSEALSDTSALANVPDQRDYLISHPKMTALKDIILSHFKKFETRNESTRVMIFSEYRDSVQEIGMMLKTLGSLVKPMVFIGQSNTSSSAGGKGLKQREQVEVVQRFRDGGFNVLVSTCVGEEGLDIGEVDLIVCFDASKSPTRLVQRMGRTGRKREGRIMFLLTQGKEERAYAASFSLQSSISKNITDASKLNSFLYKFSPRMVPVGIEPQCYKMNVLLTSEQQYSDEEVIEVESEDEDLDARPKKRTKPAPAFKKPKSKIRPTTADSRPELTLTQCFQGMFKKPSVPHSSKQVPIATATVSSSFASTSKETFDCTTPPLSTANPTTDDDIMVVDDDRSIFTEADTNDTDRNEILNDIFDVLPPSKAVALPCLNIPKPAPIVWLPEYNDLNKDLVLLSREDISRLVLKIESLELRTNHCPCGNRGEIAPPKTIVKNPDPVGYHPVKRNYRNLFNTNASPIASSSGNETEGELLEAVFMNDDPFFGEDDDDGWMQNIIDSGNTESNMNAPTTTPTFHKNHDKTPSVVIKNTNANTVATLAPTVQPAAKKTFTFKKKNTSYVPPDPDPDVESFVIENVQKSASTPQIHFPKDNIPARAVFDVDENIFDLTSSSPGSSTTSDEEQFVQRDRRGTNAKLNATDIHSTSFNSSNWQSDDDRLGGSTSMTVPAIWNLGGSANCPIKDLFVKPIRYEEPTNVTESRTEDTDEKTTGFEPPLIDVDDDSDEEFQKCLKKLEETEKNATKTINQENEDDIVLLDCGNFAEKVTTSNSRFQSGNVRVGRTEDACFGSNFKSTNNEAKKRTTENKENNSAGKLYDSNPNPLSSPPSPPSIFNRRSGLASSSSSHVPVALSTLPSFSHHNFQSSSKSIDNPASKLRASSNVNKDDSDDDFVDKLPRKTFTFKKKMSSSQSSTKKDSSHPCALKKDAGQSTSGSSSGWVNTSSKPQPEKNSASQSTSRTQQRLPSQTFKKPKAPLPRRELTSVSPLASATSRNVIDDDDDDFVPQPSRFRKAGDRASGWNRSSSEPSTSPLHSSSPLPGKRDRSVLDLSHNSSSRQLDSTFLSDTSPIAKPKPKRRRKRRSSDNVNPFIDREANVSSGSSSTDSDVDEFEGLDKYDTSFVDSDPDDGVTASQHIRYIQSVKDIDPVNPAIPEEPPRPVVDDTILDVGDDGEYDEDDSFCAKNDEAMDYEEIGVFTQAMNQARADIMNENPASAKRRKTRRQARLGNVCGGASTKVTLNPSRQQSTKRRRRIVVMDDSSSDDD